MTTADRLLLDQMRRLVKQASTDPAQLLKWALEIAEPVHPLLRPYSATLGRLAGAVTLGLGVHRPDLPFTPWTPERIEAQKKLLEEVEKKYGLEEAPGLLSLGSARVLRQLGRMWSRKDLSLLSKLIGTGLVPVEALIGTLQRGPYYSPLSNTAVVFDPSPELARHELGHMVDWASRRQKLLYQLAMTLPGLQLLREWRGSARGEASIPPEKEEVLKRYRNMLRRGFGGYVGSNVGLPLGLPEQAVGSVIGSMIARMTGAPSEFGMSAETLKRVREAIKRELERKEKKPAWQHLLGVA